MAGDTFDERLTRLEEQFKALQALTQGLAAWEMGGIGTPEPAKETTPSLTARGSTVAAIESRSSRDALRHDSNEAQRRE